MVCPAPSTNVELDRLSWFYFIGAVVFFAMAVLGLIGELLGWWNDAGAWLVGIGTGGALLLAMLGLLWSASRGQVGAIATAVNANGAKLDLANGKLDLANIKLDQLDAIQFELDRQTGVMDRQLGVLVAIRDRL